MVRQYHQLTGYEFEQTSGDSGGQKGLECCIPKGLKESTMTQRLNNNNRKHSQEDTGQSM